MQLVKSKAVNNEKCQSKARLSGEGDTSRQDVWIEDDTGSSEMGSLRSMTDENISGEWILKRSICKTDNLCGAEVLVSRKHDSSRITVTVTAASVWDLRAVHLIHSVVEFVKSYKVVRIIIDLGRTDRVEDSGLAMLLLLKKILGQKIKKIKLVNTRHLQRSHLDLLPAIFEIN